MKKPVSHNNTNIPKLEWVERIARLMDSKFSIPGTRFRFGLDPILGLFPVVGDAASFAISGGLILYMIRYGASKKVIYKMLINSVLDATIGSIPIIGTIFDFFYKANTRNINLLKEHYEQGQHKGSGTGVLITAALVVLVVLVLIIWGLVAVAQWAFDQF